MRKFTFVMTVLVMAFCFSEYLRGNDTPIPQQTAIQKKEVVPDTALKKTANQGDWKVWGQILDPGRKAVPGLTIQVYDKDLMFDDLLGTTKTDRNGKFTVYYEEKDYKELTEESPDLYIIVKDKKGRQVHSTKSQVRYRSGKDEKFDILLKLKLIIKPVLPKTLKKT